MEKIHELFHLSQTNLDGIILKPRIPVNVLTQQGYEENKTPRISFSTSIDGALTGIGSDLTGKVFFVHTIDTSYNEPIIKQVTIKEIPDVLYTDEIWVLNDVRLKCIRTIRVLRTVSKKCSYKLGSMWIDKYKWEYVDIIKVK